MIVHPTKVQGHPVWVGPSPAYDTVEGITAGERHFDVVLCVHDAPELTFVDTGARPLLKLWLPIYETAPWPYATLHAIIHTLHHHAVEKGRHVYLHCAAGCNRSPTMATLWLVAEGLSHEEAIRASGFPRALNTALLSGSLPPRAEDFARLTLLKPRRSAVGVLMEIDRKLVVDGFQAMDANRPPPATKQAAS